MTTSPSRSVELWLVRHGETVWNAAGKVCGWKDVELTERGRSQARQLGSFLSQTSFDSLWSSDLTRARETGRLALGEPRPDPRLREFHFGEVEGLIWNDLEPTVRDAILVFEGYQAPLGESLEDFRGRVYDFVRELGPGRHALFVHAGLIRLLLMAVGNDRFLPPASIAALDWTDKRFLFIREGG